MTVHDLARGRRGDVRLRPAPSIPAQLVVVAKEPVPGRVKTRLSPPYRREDAAALAEAALADTLVTVAGVEVERRVLALDGSAGPWLPTGFDVVPQRGNGLDERLAHAVDDAYAGLRRPVLLIGMDTPQVTRPLLARAAVRLAYGSGQALLGPAHDGGFWLLGLPAPDPALLVGVPMSAARTGRIQLARLRRAGLRVGLLPTLRDVDTAADARRVAAQAPASRFARVVSRIDGRRGPIGSATASP